MRRTACQHNQPKAKNYESQIMLAHQLLSASNHYFPVCPNYTKFPEPPRKGLRPDLPRHVDGRSGDTKPVITTPSGARTGDKHELARFERLVEAEIDARRVGRRIQDLGLERLRLRRGRLLTYLDFNRIDAISDWRAAILFRNGVTSAHAL